MVFESSSGIAEEGRQTFSAAAYISGYEASSGIVKEGWWQEFSAAAQKFLASMGGFRNRALIKLSFGYPHAMQWLLVRIFLVRVDAVVFHHAACLFWIQA